MSVKIGLQINAKAKRVTKQTYLYTGKEWHGIHQHLNAHQLRNNTKMCYGKDCIQRVFKK